MDAATLPDLPLLRARLTYRLLEDARLPAYKGTMLRGGFGYAFQRSTCPETCWGHASRCPEAVICPYRWVFETPRPAGVSRLHDLKDIPRPFVIDLPPDPRDFAEAGDSLEFGLTVIGHSLNYLPYFLYAFARLGEAGLGVRRARAILERVVALPPEQVTGPTIYAEGRVHDVADLPLITRTALIAQAAELPEDLWLTLRTPLRVREDKRILDRVSLGAIVRAACWRLDALDVFHGAADWGLDYRPLVAAAGAVRVESERVQWEDLGRRSDHGGVEKEIDLGGIVGSALLRGVGPELRAVLLAGGMIHVGKACVFGNGSFRVDPA